LPSFRDEITDPLYDDWLALHLEYMHRTGRRRPQPNVYHRFTDRADKLLAALDGTISTTEPDEKAQAKAIRQIIEDQCREWLTDFYAPILDRPNWRFLEETMRIAESLPDDDTQPREPELGAGAQAPLFDRLPIALIVFVNREFGSRRRDPQFWNRLRDDVSPHFREAWLASNEYADYLRMLIRHHGFREKRTLMAEVRESLQDLKAKADLPGIEPTNVYDGEGLTLELVRLKIEDLARTIENSQRRPHPPGPSPAPAGPHR
jgi:hypothetical protein